MRKFLVVEPQDRLPKWLMRTVGRYLPPAIGWQGELCDAKGTCVAFGDVESAGGQKRLIARLKRAKSEGTICGTVGISDKVRCAAEDELRSPLYDGRILLAVLRVMAWSEGEKSICGKVLLRGADCGLGQAMAAYLARRVRFLTLAGRNERVLERSAHRLWQMEGIAVTVGAGEADSVIDAGAAVQYGTMIRIGEKYVLPAVAECALLSLMQFDETCTITVGMLERLTALARVYGVGRIRGENDYA